MFPALTLQMRLPLRRTLVRLCPLQQNFKKRRNREIKVEVSDTTMLRKVILLVTQKKLYLLFFQIEFRKQRHD